VRVGERAAFKIATNTDSVLCKTSLSQKRITHSPCLFSAAVLVESALSECCDPSSSTTSFASWQ